MKSVYLYNLIELFFSDCSLELSMHKINVTDHGMVPNTKQSITSKINTFIEGLSEGSTTVSFLKGRYDFYPDSIYFRPYFETNTYDINPKRLAILIEIKKNITIDVQGSDFICHIQSFTLDNSENIILRNVNIGWKLPLTAESEVLEADSTHILIKIDKLQFPYMVHNKGLTFTADDWKEE